MIEGEATQQQDLVGRIAELEASLVGAQTSLVSARASLVSAQATIAEVTVERDKLRHAYKALKEQYELLRRQIYAARAERIDATKLEAEFAETKKELDALVNALGEQPSDAPEAPPQTPPPPPAGPPAKPKRNHKPKGRRDLKAEDIPVVRIEILDPAFEGIFERIRFEESSHYGHRRAGPVRVVVARAIYKMPSPSTKGPTFELITAAKPEELFKRGLLAPSMIAHVVVQKYRWGLPFHRLSRMLALDGIKLDDGLMCRYAEDLGATAGCIVAAMAKDAMENAFCLSTDATGVCIQPVPLPSGQRQACRKGHFFVVLADQDHIFFEFQPKHTSAAVCGMFRGFSGYIQADAHAIYDSIFRGEARTCPDQELPKEVGCWAHCRRKFWDAMTITKNVATREAVFRMKAVFDLEEQWASLPPSQRHAQRQLVARPLLDNFFAWVTEQYALVQDTRGLVATAFGYAVRQEGPLRCFLEDGRLVMTNNHSERALRGPIASGRKAWLFFGSDDHATAAANLFSLIVSCELHRLDPELYLAEIIHVLPYWPRDRYLELAPKYWAATRARLNPKELAVEYGTITVPPLASSEK